jgi:hypothetical protein
MGPRLEVKLQKMGMVLVITDEGLRLGYLKSGMVRCRLLIKEEENIID